MGRPGFLQAIPYKASIPGGVIYTVWRFTDIRLLPRKLRFTLIDGQKIRASRLPGMITLWYCIFLMKWEAQGRLTIPAETSILKYHRECRF